MQTEIYLKEDEEKKESSPSDLIEALTDLHKKVREGLTLIELRDDIEIKFKELYNKRYSTPEEKFPMVIMIHLGDESAGGEIKEKTTLFYAFTTYEEGVDRDSLNLQLIPSIGRKYPEVEDQLKDIVDVALKENTPLYAQMIQPKNKKDEDPDNYIYHYYHCWRASDIIRTGNKNNIFDNPKYKDVVLLEPSFSTKQASQEKFFENILISTNQVVWPFSDKRILTTTIISLKGKGRNDKSFLSQQKYLPSFIFDCSIGMVISQLFLSYALIHTSSKDFKPLIHEILMKSWKLIIKDFKNKEENIKNDIIKQILNIGEPFVLMSVLRNFIQDFSADDLNLLLENDIIEKLAKQDVPMMGSLIAADQEKKESLNPLYENIVNYLLEKFSEYRSNEEYKLEILLGNLGEFFEFASDDILTLILELSKKQDLPEVVQQEIFGILIKALNQRREVPIEQSLENVSDFLKNTTDEYLRHSFSSCSASLLNKNFLEHIGPETLEKWNLQPDISKLLMAQIKDINIRFESESQKTPKLVGIFSQKGGVGKSTVALMVAAKLANNNKRVCIVELDFGGPTFFNYIDIENGPFINDFFKIAHKSNIGEIYKEKYKNKLPPHWSDGGDNPKLSIWPVNPSWEEQVQIEAESPSHLIQRGYEQSVLKKLISLLKEDFDYIIFDTPAEIRDISLSIGNLISNRGGTIILVSSLFTPSCSPLIEHYWRFFSSDKISLALIVNKARLLDINIIYSRTSLLDYLLSQKNKISIRAFGLNINSPSLLKTLFPQKMSLIPIKYFEDIERVGRSKNIKEMIKQLKEMNFPEMEQFLTKALGGEE